MAEKKKGKAKKNRVVVEAVGQVHIKATFNNIIISITNNAGQVITWSSAEKWVSGVLRKTRLMLPR